MTRRTVWLGSALLALAGLGCDGPAAVTVDSGNTVDGGDRDAAIVPDGGRDAAALPDGGVDAHVGDDDGGTDGGEILDGGTDGGADAGDEDASTSPDAGMAMGDFTVGSFDTTNCATIEVESLVGDDRGGIGVSADRVLLVGDDATATWDLELADGQPVQGAISTTANDNLVSDVATGQLYLLGTDAGPFTRSEDGVTQVLTRLITALDDGTEGATEVTLSLPITLASEFAGDVGIFAGSGEVGIYDGSHVFTIALATGAVTDLGPVTLSHETCESWAFWGVIEHVGAAHSLVFAQDSTTIARVAVPSGTVTSIGTFTNLSDMCSLTVSPTNSRWYFHHESTSQFSSDFDLFEVLGYCGATFDTTGGNFSIATLTAEDCAVVDADDLIGDDHGGIAVSVDGVWLMGDEGIGRWTAELTDPAGSVVPLHDAVFTNLHGATMWSLADDAGLLPNGGGELTRVIQLSSDGRTTTTSLALSAPIMLSGEVGIFSGWDELVLHDGTHAWSVDLISGTVTDLGAMDVPEHQGCENWAYWGIAERVGTVRSVIAVNGAAPTISRYTVPSGTATVVSTFTDLSDMCSISLSADLDRWYFHHENSSQFTDPVTPPFEALGYCDAVITHP